MIDYVMLLSRLISWGGLLFSAGFWIACENEGEMILGFMGTVAFLTLTITPPTLLSFSKMDRIKRRQVRQVTPVMEADIVALLSVGMDKKIVASVFNVSLRTVYKIQEKDDGN